MDTLHQSDSIGNLPTKKCIGPCGRTLPATTEFFRKQKAGKYGLQSRCKECCSYLWKNPPEKPTPPPDGYKLCIGPCGRTLLATTEFFHKCTSGKYGLHAWCKECRKAYQDEYRQEHYEKLLEQNRNYHRKHREEINASRRENEQKKAYEKIYRQKYREERIAYNKVYREEHREEMNKQHRNYCKEHREELNAYQRARYPERREEILERRKTPHGRMIKRASEAKRRAQKKGSDGSNTAAQLQEQLKRQKGRCYWRGCKLGKGKGAWHIDHIVPLSRGGTNTMDNIVISCPTCNMHRHNRLPHEVPDFGRLI